MRFLRKLCIHGVTALLAVTATVIGTSTSAQAYNLLYCQYNASGNALKWQDTTTRSAYSTPAHSSIAAWNNSSSQIQFTKVTYGANLRITDGNFGNTDFYGILLDASGVNPDLDNPLRSCTNGYWTQTNTAWWNRYWTDPFSNGAKQSTMVHEIGHALGLAHRFTSGQLCSYISMMDYFDERWSRCGWNTPRLDDINGVQTLY